MCCQELVTSVEEDIPVIVLLMRDNRLGMISQLQDAFYDKRYNCIDLGTVADFTKIAEGMGVVGIRVEKPIDIQPAIKKAINSNKTTVIEFVLDNQDNTYPMVTGQCLTDIVEE